MNQSTLNQYFKIKNKQMDKGFKRKYNLSLSKTPNKSIENENDSVQNVINLISDDEEELPSLKTCKLERNLSSSSESTIVYTPENHSRSLVTPSSSQENLFKDPSTPSSSLKGSPRSSTSTRKNKFYSPNKKRSITNQTPTKVKRNLSQYIQNSSQSQNSEDFLQASQDVDDKTVFLLKIIDQFLHDDDLKALLSESSCSLLFSASQVKKPGMRLVCRLYWQLEGWYRWEKVKKIMTDKAEVDDPTMHGAIQSLIEFGFIDLGNSYSGRVIDFDQLVKMLKLDELKGICKGLKIKATKKEDIVQAFRSYCNQKPITNYFIVNNNKNTNEERLLKLLRSEAGPCYKLSDEARNTLKELYILMYLGINYDTIREKKLELMLLNEKTNKETYPINKDMEIDNASLVFKNRNQFVCYMNACSLYEELEEATEVNKKCEIVERVYKLYNAISEDEMMGYMNLSVWLHRYTPAYIYVKILDVGIQELKKDKVDRNIVLAVDILSTLINQNLFRQHRKSEWYSEKALILDKYLGKFNEAAEVLLEGFNSSLSEEAQDCMRPRAKLLANRKTNPISKCLQTKLLTRAERNDILEKNINAEHIYKQPMYTPTKGKIKFETRTDEGRMVHEAEEYCVYHFIKEGKYTYGGHWEGRIVTTIFFLLFWDIIYAELQGVRGIFLSYYQSFPLDMFTESFYTNRKALIEAKLKEIQDSYIEDILSQMQYVWDSRPEGELSGLQRNIGWEAVRDVAACLAPARLAALCRRLAHDYRHWHSGFPDLTLWNPTTREIAFVEVKTDTDKPSMKQIQWMHYMRQHGIDAKFCYIGVNTARARSRNTDDLDN